MPRVFYKDMNIVVSIKMHSIHTISIALHELLHTGTDKIEEKLCNHIAHVNAHQM